MNNIKISGYITRDIDIKLSPKGKPYAVFAIVNNENKNPEYFNIEFWSASANTLAPKLKKGDLVVVTGSAHPRTFTDRDGNKRFYFSVSADTIAKQSIQTMTVDSFSA